MFGLEQLYGFFKREVITVEILHVVTHLKDVVDDAAIDGLLKEMLRFEYHVVATQNAFAVGIADELIHQSQATQVFLKVCRIFVNGELVAVVEGEGLRHLVEQQDLRVDGQGARQLHPLKLSRCFFQELSRYSTSIFSYLVVFLTPDRERHPSSAW